MGNDSSKQQRNLHEWKDFLESSRQNFYRSTNGSADEPALFRPQDEKNGFSLDDFEIYCELGSGAFADVFAGVHKASKHWIALKMLDKRKVIERCQEEHVKTERRLLAQMNIPFIIKLHLSFQMKSTLCLGLEFVPGGELFTLLRQKGQFTEKQAIFYAAQVIICLEYMHNLDVIYRDLKPENILLDSRGYLKVADFGFAKVVQKRTYTMCGTPEYISPEILAYKGYGKAVDWWALGVLIYEMLCGHSPFYADEVMEIYSNIMEAKIKFPRELNLSRASRHLIKHLLEKDLTKRYGNLHAGVADIREHPWFLDFDWVAIFEGTIPAPFKINPARLSKPDRSQLKKLNAILSAESGLAYEWDRFDEF